MVLFRRLGWKPEDYDAWAQALHDDQVAFIPPTQVGGRDGRPVRVPASGHQHGPGARGPGPDRVAPPVTSGRCGPTDRSSCPGSPRRRRGRRGGSRPAGVYSSASGSRATTCSPWANGTMWSRVAVPPADRDLDLVEPEAPVAGEHDDVGERCGQLLAAAVEQVVEEHRLELRAGPAGGGRLPARSGRRASSAGDATGLISRTSRLAARPSGGPRPASSGRHPRAEAHQPAADRVGAAVSGRRRRARRRPPTRSGIAAAQARVYGPPPDSPMTAILSMPSVSAMIRRSSANAATLSYWYGVDEPMPGRSTPISRMWCCSA